MRSSAQLQHDDNDLRCACVQAAAATATGSDGLVNLAPEAVDIVHAPAFAHGRKPVIHPGVRRQCLTVRQIAIDTGHLHGVIVIQLLQQDRPAMAFVGAEGLSLTLREETGLARVKRATPFNTCVKASENSVVLSAMFDSPLPTPRTTPVFAGCKPR